MKIYDSQISKEKIKELNSSLYNTKITQSTIECRFEPQFSLLDRRGEVALALKEVFPDDVEDYDVESDLEFEYGLDSIKINSPNTITQSCVELARAYFSRGNIVPTTLPHFSRIAIEYLDTYEKIFPNIKKLERFGFRIKQQNKIPEEKIKSCKNKFSNEFLNLGMFASKLKNKNTNNNIKFNEFAVIFSLKETIADNDYISDYHIKITISLSGIDNSYLKSDMDFYLKDDEKKDKPILFKNAKIFCKRVVERADEIHKLIFEVITDV